MPASRDGRRYVIPLEEQHGEQRTHVQLTYAGAPASAWKSIGREYRAPRFALPMNDIEWTFFVPPERRYFGFGGTMTRREELAEPIERFSSQRYLSWNKEQRELSIRKAKDVLDQGNTLMLDGKQRHAKREFQQALNYSQVEEDLNEDARVQLRNLEKQQWKMGLVNRRDAVKMSHNIFDEAQAGRMDGFHDGDYTQEYASKVERNLTQKDNTGLELVADKMIKQQAAAAGMVTAISVTMPEHGRRLQFVRTVQIDPEADVTVRFHVSRASLGGSFAGVLAAGVLFGLLRALVGRFRRR